MAQVQIRSISQGSHARSTRTAGTTTLAIAMCAVAAFAFGRQRGH